MVFIFNYLYILILDELGCFFDAKEVQLTSHFPFHLEKMTAEFRTSLIKGVNFESNPKRH
jgi:hypothetical protein